ncbi:MAG: hypothetical protein ACI8ZN_002256 [Bacteroidia bacterium]|jgi:hypothetical protein
MYSRFLFYFVGFFLSSVAFGQQTLGLFHYDSTSIDGYTLMPPFASSDVHLLNNCGHVVNTWKTSATPGANTILKSNGNLLRSVHVENPFNLAGGNGGRLEEYNWEGELVWSMDLYSDTFSQHHDFKIMPNGNILVLIWELVPNQIALDNGKQLDGLPEDVWQESIWELKPEADSGAAIVWKWNTLSHIVQDADKTKINYGEISEHPELIDFNSHIISNLQDWLHFNSIDYNADLDQIMVSCHGLSEIYIIDHSTTQAQSSGHFGGKQNKGGDILFRYGNPQIYGRGGAIDQVSFKQHDAQWIKKGFANAGQIIFFNNGGARKYSSIDRFAPVVDGPGSYLLQTNKPFGPAGYDWTYTAPNQTDFYSVNMSAVQPLSNGHLLITESTKGHIFELDQNQKITWSYVNPINNKGALEQGAVPIGINVFRGYKYAANSAAFQSKNIKEGARLELNALPIHCDDTTGKNVGQDTTGGSNSIFEMAYNLNVYPNPCVNELNIGISEATNNASHLVLTNTMGIEVRDVELNPAQSQVNLQDLAAGIYIVRLYNNQDHFLGQSRLVKR